MSVHDPVSFFANTVSGDFFALMCGPLIGEGQYRSVYECSMRSDLVVKFDIASRSFQNPSEWMNWVAHENTPKVSRWLAPCIAISPCGTILLQKRTTPALRKAYPAKLPAFLGDLKRSNFGMLNGHLVCHDYGMINYDLSLRERKADWWDG